MGLPPTTLKGVNDTTGKTTFQTVFTNLKVSHSGPVGTIGPIYQAGSPNYLASNNDAELDTTGWATYADAAQATPVDGTGGVANVTWTRSTSSPLRNTASFLFTKDAVNRQGQGASFDFSIDSTDQAKVLQITFDYNVASGTYADSDLTVYLYDRTNSLVIQPAGYSIVNASVSMKQIATFQTASNSTSYRLIIHVASTSAVAYTVQFDNFQVGPQAVTNGAAITDWVSYTPTFTGFGTVTGISFRSRRVGDSLEVMGTATTGTTTATQAQMTLGFNGVNGNVVVDSSKVSSLTPLGFAENSYASTTQFAWRVIAPSSSVNYVNFAAQTSTTSNLTAINGNGFASSQTIAFHFKVPIVGWSSNLQLSSDTDSRVCAFYGNSGTASLSSSYSDVTLTTVKDTHGAFSTTTYTIPISGYYKFTADARMSSSGAITATNAIGLQLTKNGSATKTRDDVFLTTSAQWVNLAHEDYFNAGDTIKLQAKNANASPIFSVAPSLYVERLSGPAVVAASESVVVSYRNTSAQSIPNNATTTVTGWTKVKDSHNAFTTSGVFTAPVSGCYRASLRVSIAPTVANTGSLSAYIIQAGSATTDGQMVLPFATTVTTSVQVTDTYQMLAGDTLTFQCYQNNGAAKTLSANAYDNSVSIERVGNY